MKYKYINFNDLRTIYPNNINILNKEDKEYLDIYFSYRSLFTDFIIEKINLKKYDEVLTNSKLNFKPQNKEDMDIYQYFSSDILKYFYIRNNTYIENLTNEEKEYFKNKKNYELDDEAREIIEASYTRVIFEDVMRNGEECMTFYGPENSNFIADNNALVIGVRYDEFDDTGLDMDEWDTLHDQQLFYLYSLLEEMNENLQNILEVPISILKYDEFSVRRLEEDKDIEEER